MYSGPQPKAVIKTTRTPDGRTIITQVQTNGPVTAATAAAISQVVAAAQHTMPPLMPVAALPPLVPVAPPVLHLAPSAIRRIHPVPVHHAHVGLHGPVGIVVHAKVRGGRVMQGAHPAIPVVPAAHVVHSNLPAGTTVRKRHK